MRSTKLIFLTTIFGLSMSVAGLSQASQDSVESLSSTTLKIGIFPRRSVNMTEKLFNPLQQELSRALQVNVELLTTYDFASFWENVAKQKYDLVHYNQYHYIKSHKLFGYNAIAQNIEFNQPTIAAAIIVRKDSGINSLQELKGKKIVFGGGRSAMIAYIATTHLLKSAGLKKGDYFEQFALTPPKAVIASYYHQAAAAGASHYVLSLPSINEKIDTSELRYLAVGEPMASLPWAIRNGIPNETVVRIKSFFLNLHKTEQGRSVLESARINRFVQVSDKDFDPHRKIVSSVLDEHY